MAPTRTATMLKTKEETQATFFTGLEAEVNLTMKNMLEAVQEARKIMASVALSLSPARGKSVTLACQISHQ